MLARRLPFRQQGAESHDVFAANPFLMRMELAGMAGLIHGSLMTVS